MMNPIQSCQVPAEFPGGSDNDGHTLPRRDVAMWAGRTSFSTSEIYIVIINKLYICMVI